MCDFQWLSLFLNECFYALKNNHGRFVAEFSIVIQLEKCLFPQNYFSSILIFSLKNRAGFWI